MAQGQRVTPATRREAVKALVSAGGIGFAAPPVLVSPTPYFDLAGEEFGARMILAQSVDGIDLCLRPDFTLPLAIDHIRSGAATPAAYGYLGPVFRQRSDGPAEFEQAGIELLAAPDATAALDTVVGFVRAVLDVYDVTQPGVRVGDIDLFEALLAACDAPDVWRPRIRARFGHTEALLDLLDRLSRPRTAEPEIAPVADADLVEWIGEQMLASGLSLTESRGPDEIAARYREKQALRAAPVPAETLTLLRRYLAISGPPEAAFAAIADLGTTHGLDLEAPLAVARERMERLAADLAGARFTFDAAFSPRLDYYTGITFEVTGMAGAVLVSGGQYDRLLRRLGAAEDIPAVGCAAWLDRLETECAP